MKKNTLFTQYSSALTALCFCMVLNSSLFAQSINTTGNKNYILVTDSLKALTQSQNETHQMAIELNLTPAQIQQVQVINQNYYMELNMAYSSATSTVKVPDSKINKINDNRVTALSSVLTNSQMELYKSMKN